MLAHFGHGAMSDLSPLCMAPALQEINWTVALVGCSLLCEVPDATLRRRQKQRNYSRVSFRIWGPMTRYRRVKFLNTSSRCFNSLSVRANGVTIRCQGTKAPVKTLEARDRRSPLTTWRMSRIAKGSYCRARCSQKQALAQIAKSGGLRFRSELLAVLASGRGGCQCWRFLTREALLCTTAST